MINCTISKSDDYSNSIIHHNESIQISRKSNSDNSYINKQNTLCSNNQRATYISEQKTFICNSDNTNDSIIRKISNNLICENNIYNTIEIDKNSFDNPKKNNISKSCFNLNSYNSEESDLKKFEDVIDIEDNIQNNSDTNKITIKDEIISCISEENVNTSLLDNSTIENFVINENRVIDIELERLPNLNLISSTLEQMYFPNNINLDNNTSNLSIQEREQYTNISLYFRINDSNNKYIDIICVLIIALGTLISLVFYIYYDYY
ncbi:hypothetical protein NAPIS_ORF01912 [Vairimorpha apis BRL 01]|uniref:Uncharacterized protein n=1 Tax=Vairimorpha apis BRL 01 TaxID=1037528 RepID=T0L7V5_9MICR|nr:hypothetical protein NAPIS_ORF01912 [Vairimorpha apis BRL 01]